ncbi:YidB family protein [Chelatococcus sp. GCM10030263]|uniref:YidB family protein n=1 Tax=Chelatococcus sp. GCM10030263 TaxID=3273387 RepID=UPI003619A669
MGLLDNLFNQAVPDGNIAKPAMIALGALLVGKMLTSGQSAQPAADPQAGDSATAAAPSGGDLVSGLGGLLQRLQDAGHGDTVNSWVGTGQNNPIHPDHLGAALGQNTVSDLAQQAGVNQQELLSVLAQALPALIDRFTPNGRLPTSQEAHALVQQ